MMGMYQTMLEKIFTDINTFFDKEYDRLKQDIQETQGEVECFV